MPGRISGGDRNHHHLGPGLPIGVNASGDLSFVTVRVVDRNGVLAPRAKELIHFTVDGPGEIVATDNGDPTSFRPFQSHELEAFNRLALVVVRAHKGATGRITVTASTAGMKNGVAVIRASGRR